jgi:UDP-3-O-[3-hydroxymyristoyl] N-acetylglucosamine deacetylase
MNRATIAREISATGVALHAGVPVAMTVKPATGGAGIVFRRADLGRDIPARFDRVGETRLGTVIEQQGASVAVVEHLMAAVAGAEIDDLLVILDGPEPPILDGDALSYLQLLHRAGRREQPIPRQAIKVLKNVSAVDDRASATLSPADRLSYHFEVSYPATPIGTQRLDFVFSRDGFAREIAPARTFGFLHELDYLKSIDRAHGASLENTLAIDGDKVLNRDLMRFADEFARHKILDAIGDMALAGCPLIARFDGIRSGHGLNNALLRALFADPANYRLVEL